MENLLFHIKLIIVASQRVHYSTTSMSWKGVCAEGKALDTRCWWGAERKALDTRWWWGAERKALDIRCWCGCADEGSGYQMLVGLQRGRPWIPGAWSGGGCKEEGPGHHMFWGCREEGPGYQMLEAALFVLGNTDGFTSGGPNLAGHQQI